MSIKDELLAIKGDEDFLVPLDAVEWAKDNPKSDLYAALEWNDSKAAHEYRLSQVRHLVRIHLVFEESNVRSFVSLSIDRSRDGGGYREVNDVLASEQLHEILLRDALNELDRVKRRYGQIKALQPIWQTLGKVRKSQKAKQSRRRRKGGGSAHIGAA
jgi:hypothetical protein